MRQPTRSTQLDFFVVPTVPPPLVLPTTAHAELVSLLCTLLLEVMCQQPPSITAQKEPNHE